MIEVVVKNEIISILDKKIIVKEIGNTLKRLGYDIDKYILTEYINSKDANNYKIEFYNKLDI